MALIVASRAEGGLVWYLYNYYDEQLGEHFYEYFDKIVFLK